MAALCSAVLVCLSALLSVGSSGGLPDISDPQFIQSCVKLHNTHRSQAQPPARDMQYMTWDEALAKSAKSWAKKCQASHNPLLKQAGKLHPEFPRVGENIWVGLPVSSFSVENALRAWNDERQHYTLRTNTCNKTCGHYTQLLWAKSYKVGCAVLPCPRGITGFSDSPKAGIFVCNYGEGGNLAGAAPYTEGPSCAVCSKDHCESNLCRDPKRDAVKTHDWSLPVDSSSSALSIFQRTAATSQSQSLMVLFLVLVSVY